MNKKKRKVDGYVGHKFGYWTVLDKSESEYHWLCQCICGKIKPVRIEFLFNGRSKSCMCRRPHRSVSKNHEFYKLTGTRIFNSYRGMIERCKNPKHKKYHRYGGRGISVCKEWLDNPMSFVRWAMDNGYNDNLTIERKNNDGNYTPDNCTWATIKTQARNRSTNVILRFKNETKTASEWADQLGIPTHTILGRYKKGWPIEKILSKQKFFDRKGCVRIKLNELQVLEIRRIKHEQKLPNSEIAKRFSINYRTVGYIINRKIWTHI